MKEYTTYLVILATLAGLTIVLGAIGILMRERRGDAARLAYERRRQLFGAGVDQR